MLLSPDIEQQREAEAVALKKLFFFSSSSLSRDERNAASFLTGSGEIKGRRRQIPIAIPGISTDHLMLLAELSCVRDYYGRKSNYGGAAALVV